MSRFGYSRYREMKLRGDMIEHQVRNGERSGLTKKGLIIVLVILGVLAVSRVPEEAKTLEELIEMFGRCTPQIDKFVDTIIVNNPDVTTPDGGVNIDKIVAVVVSHS